MNQYSDVCIDGRWRGGSSRDCGIAACGSLSRDSWASRNRSGGPMKCGEITRALLGGFARLRLPASETDTERPREFDELPGVRGNPSSGWPPERLGDLEVTAAIGDERSVGLLSNGRCPVVLMMRFPPDMPTRFSHLRAPTALPARNLPGDAATHVAAACHPPSCKIRSISEHNQNRAFPHAGRPAEPMDWLPPVQNRPCSPW